MPKYIKTDKSQDNVFAALSLNKLLIEGTLKHTIQYLVENKIDMIVFEKKT